MVTVSPLGVFAEIVKVLRGKRALGVPRMEPVDVSISRGSCRGGEMEKSEKRVEEGVISGKGTPI